MFAVATPASIQLAVDIDPPEGAGASGACTIDIRYLGIDGRLEFLRRITAENLTDMQILDDLLVGWDGITSSGGAHLDFNCIETRSQVLDVPWVFTAIRGAVLRELGLGEAVEKNS